MKHIKMFEDFKEKNSRKSQEEFGDIKTDSGSYINSEGEEYFDEDEEFGDIKTDSGSYINSEGEEYFNESYKVDTEYIKNCFVELSDSYKIEYLSSVYSSAINFYYGINIKLETDYNYEDDGYNLEDFLSLANKISDISEKLDDAINKVKIKYSNIEVLVDFFRREGEENIHYTNIRIYGVDV
jgi:hypothetical protein